jgi:hypothetical protein
MPKVLKIYYWLHVLKNGGVVCLSSARLFGKKNNSHINCRNFKKFLFLR